MPYKLHTDMPASKVYWIGNHTARPAWGAPVPKMHKAGLQLLQSMGWVQVENDYVESEPVFAFTTRKGANYPADQPGLPTVRQLPHENTACLDDKRRMAQCLAANGCQHLMPSSWDTIDAYLACLTEQHGMQQEHPQWQQQKGDEVESQQQCSSPSIVNGAGAGEVTAGVALGASSMALPAASFSSSNSVADTVLQAPLPGGSVFVKHRRGVKGQAVYVAHNLEEVQQLQQRLKITSQDFVVQQEVCPMLIHGRKFVLRMHVLISAASYRRPPNTARSKAVDCEQQQLIAAGDVRTETPKLQNFFDVYVHEDVIVVQHAQAYVQGSRSPAVNISSKGKHHPVPVLLQQSPLVPELRVEIWAQLQQLAAQCIYAVAGMLMPAVVHPDTMLYHLFGLDCMVDASGKVVLLEVNSYPAIASGTMASVDVGVYTRLIEDMIRLLILPVSDGVEPDPGGFIWVHRR